MTSLVSNDLLRAQTTIAALCIFAILRLLLLAWGPGVRVSRPTLNLVFVGAALLYCDPELTDALITGFAARREWPVLDGKLLGCTLAYFCASLLYRELTTPRIAPPGERNDERA
jgi:hypothetical protein